MSALQKYKQEVKRLAEENTALRKENEKLKAGQTVFVHAEAMDEGVAECILKRSFELGKRLVPLASGHGGHLLMVSIIEEALHEAFESGREDVAK